MTAYQSLESALIPPVQKALQELAVFQASNLRANGEAADVLEDFLLHNPDYPQAAKVRENIVGLRQ